jgi:hypothetical protein
VDEQLVAAQEKLSSMELVNVVTTSKYYWVEAGMNDNRMVKLPQESEAFLQ